MRLSWSPEVEQGKKELGLRGGGRYARSLVAWGYLWLLPVSVFVLACSSRPPTPPARETIDRVLPPSLPAPSGTSAKTVDVYIDDSGSMSGFVTDNNSRYDQVLSDVVLSPSGSDLAVQVYALSSMRPIGSLPLSKIESPGFYRSQETPLASLLHTIASHPDHSAILISDLVLSERGADMQQLEAALSEVASSEPYLRLLAFRSDFYGSYTPESRGATKLEKIAITDRAPDAGRPFYMLVFAANEASMTKLQRYVLNQLKAAEQFDPVTPPFSVESVALDQSGKDPSTWMGVRRFVKPDPSRLEFSSAYGLQKAPSPGVETEPLPLKVSFKAHIPFREVPYLQLAGRRASWGKVHAPVTEAATIPITGIIASDHSTMKLSLQIPVPDKQTWDFYRLELRPGQGNLDVPDWVHIWSTTDDSQAAHLGQTLELEKLVETMERTTAEHQLCGDWLLGIGRGN